MTRVWCRIASLGAAVVVAACGEAKVPAKATSSTPCGSAPGLRAGGTVPAGDAAFVVYGRECPERTLPRDVRITDSAGTELSVQLEPLEERSADFLVRTEPPLVPGTYQVVTPDGRLQTLTVTDAAELPTALGELTVKSERNCARVFDLALTEGALAYASLMGLDIYLGYPGEVGTLTFVPSAGTLEVSDGHVELDLFLGLNKPDEQQIELRPYIIGYEAEVLPAVTTFDYLCAVQ